MSKRKSAHEIWNIVRRRVRHEIMVHVDPDEWRQEALVGYELARRLYPDDEGEQVYGAIAAVQKLARREHTVRRYIVSTDEIALLESGAHRFDVGFTLAQHEAFYEMLKEEDNTTREIFRHILNGDRQYIAANKVGISHASANRKINRFLEKAREKIGEIE